MATNNKQEDELTAKYGEEYLGQYDRENLPRACRRWCGNASEEGFKKFARFLGHPFDRRRRIRIVPTYLPEIRDLIDKINGPHGEAILKVLEIRNAERSRRTRQRTE